MRMGPFGYRVVAECVGELTIENVMKLRIDITENLGRALPREIRASPAQVDRWVQARLSEEVYWPEARTLDGHNCPIWVDRHIPDGHWTVIFAELLP